MDQPGVQLFAQARGALRTCLPALGLLPGDEVLVPSYHHGSEVEALLRTGFVCRFFDGRPDLQPDEEELERLLGPRTRALHLIHYLGFPQDAARWRAWCDGHGLLLIEDAAQAWLAETVHGPVGTHGDLAVFCLYKTVGLPDGAAAVGRAVLPPALPGRRGLLDLVHPALHGIRRRVPRPPGQRPFDVIKDIAVPDEARAATAATVWLVPRVADAGVAAQRRRNYRRLLRDLSHLVPEPFGTLPAGASPFAFPIGLTDKATALRLLCAAGVEALDLWSHAHPRLPEEHQRSSGAVLRRTVVGLPVHQGLGEAELRHLVDVVRSFAPAPAHAA